MHHVISQQQVSLLFYQNKLMSISIEAADRFLKRSTDSPGENLIGGNSQGGIHQGGFSWSRLKYL